MDVRSTRISPSSGGRTPKQTAFLIGTIIVIAMIVAAMFYDAYTNPDDEDGDRLSVVASFYPLGHFAREIGGEHVTVQTLIPENSELHAWQPSPGDIVAADDADVLVYNGAGLDPWFEDDILAAIDIGDAVVVETTHGIALLGDGRGGHGDEHDHGDMDPHTWISPYVAMQQAEAIYSALVQKDPDRAANYTTNWNVLKQRFEDLDSDFMLGLGHTEHDEVIVTHEAFGYLAHRYGFEQHGVIGLSADEQPSASTIVTITDLMVDHGVSTIYVDPGYSDDHARTLRTEVERKTGETVTILKLYFMGGEIDGLDYFGQQERNLENLLVGLGAHEQE